MCLNEQRLKVHSIGMIWIKVNDLRSLRSQYIINELMNPFRGWFVGSFDVLQSKKSWITEPDPNHPNESNPQRTDSQGFRQHLEVLDAELQLSVLHCLYHSNNAECRSHKLLGGSKGMLPLEIFIIGLSKMKFPAFPGPELINQEGLLIH